MKFAMLINGDPDAWENLPPGVFEQSMKDIYAWLERWQAAGKIADSGAELQHKRTAKTVRKGPDGRPVVTDGPYLELKEVIGGVILLECDDMDEAVSIAAQWPMHADTDSVEVRPVMVR